MKRHVGFYKMKKYVYMTRKENTEVSLASVMNLTKNGGNFGKKIKVKLL
jgi:hypothetical protein